MVLQSLEGLPLRHLNKVIITITIIINILYLVCLSWCRPISLTMLSFFLFFFFKSHTAKSLWSSFGVLPEILLNRLPCLGKLIASHFAVFIFRGKNSCNFCRERSAVESKQSNGTFCIQVREISCYLLLIIKSVNNMEETTSRWIQITVIPFLSKKCTFGTERVSVLEICLSYKVLKMTGQKKRRD